MKDDKVISTCPFCGIEMIEKPKILERKKFECPCCGYSNLMYNRTETAIINGKMDDEITKQLARDLSYQELYPIPETEFEEEL